MSGWIRRGETWSPNRSVRKLHPHGRKPPSEARHSMFDPPAIGARVKLKAFLGDLNPPDHCAHHEDY